MPTDDEIYGRSALKNGEPWITPGSLKLLKTLVKPEWNIFEWGSGGSTVYWSKNCASVISIEQNSEWIKRTTDMLKKFQCADNCTLKYVQCHNDNYYDYANIILEHSNESFDLIYVDGEAACRNLCIANAIDKLKPNGYLLVDNSNWINKQLPQFNWQQSFLETGLKWVGQKDLFDWETTIFKKC